MELSDLLSDKLLSFCWDFDTDDDIDAVIAAALDVLHQSGPAPTDTIHRETTDSTSSTPTTTCNINARFTPPKTDDEIKQLHNKGSPRRPLKTPTTVRRFGNNGAIIPDKQADIPAIQTMLPFPATSFQLLLLCHY